MNNENNKMNNQGTKIIGYDPETREPIYSYSLIDDNINFAQQQKEETIEKKTLSKGKFIFSVLVSFLIWNFVSGFLINNLLVQLVFKSFDSVNFPIWVYLWVYIFLINAFWILESVLEIYFSYRLNRFKTVEEYQYSSTRNVLLLIFYISILLINKSTISILAGYNPILQYSMLVIHIVVIWFMNKKMFYKWIV